MEATSWLPEHSAALRDLRIRGMSYSQIADTINARFNTAYTRYAALSRGQRMGLGCFDRLEPSLPELPGRPDNGPEQPRTRSRLTARATSAPSQEPTWSAGRRPSRQSWTYLSSVARRSCRATCRCSNSSRATADIRMAVTATARR